MSNHHSALSLLSEYEGGKPRKLRLAYVVSHPIQYQAPLLRRIAKEDDIELTVFFGSDFSVRNYQDKGFGVDVKWDVPLLDGFRSELLPHYRDAKINGVLSPISRSFSSVLTDRAGNVLFDALWVHGYSSVNALHAMVTAKSLGIPVLVRAESWLGVRPRGRGRLLVKKIFFSLAVHMIDGILAIGTRNREYWEHYLGRDFPIFLMPYAVDNAYFQRLSLEAHAGREDFRRELKLESGRPVILFASKLQTRKHCDDLLRAYASLSEGDGLDPKPYLVIVGDGEERGALERQAAATGFKSIRFCGFRNQSELPRFFDLCSVFVLPSRDEAWGLIVNEAMNAGRAVIVSDEVGCQSDLVTDGVEGGVYPAGDIDRLQAALLQILASPDVTLEFGARALLRIQKWSFEQDIQGLRLALSHITRRLPT